MGDCTGGNSILWLPSLASTVDFQPQSRINHHCDVMSRRLVTTVDSPIDRVGRIGFDRDGKQCPATLDKAEHLDSTRTAVMWGRMVFHGVGESFVGSVEGMTG